MSVSPHSWAYQQQTRYRFWRWLLRDILLRYVGFRALVVPHVEGLENIPPDTPTILMMNHSFTIDGVIVLGLIRQRDVIPLIKSENFDLPLIGFLAKRWGAYGIHRGEIDREALQTTLDLLKLKQLVLIAPEGTRQKHLMRPKDGLCYLALKADPVIVPTALWHGENWYQDLFRPRRTHVQVRFGKAFRLKAAGRRVSREEMSQITEEMMFQVARLLPPDYRGDYADLEQMTTKHLDFC